MRYPERMARVNRVFTNPVMRPLARVVPPWAIVHHVGRKSGTAYRSPVVAFPIQGGFLIPLAYGPNRDWVKNVVATGSFELERRGRFVTVTDPVVHLDEVPSGVPSAMAKTIRRLDLPGVLTVRRTTT
jgi:deazaflavin-dependent oxidoreductase (nitroreductase family)